MKTLLTLTAIIEGVTGLVLMAIPTVVVPVLLGFPHRTRGDLGQQTNRRWAGDVGDRLMAVPKQRACAGWNCERYGIL